MTFDELVAERSRLHELCNKHVSSLLKFKFESGPSFKLHWDEKAERPGLRHLTTSATCIESLLDCHPKFLAASALEPIRKALQRPSEEVQTTDDITLDALCAEFASAAQARPVKKWRSEKSAPIYCTVRTLPLVLRAAIEWRPLYGTLLRAVYRQLHKPDRFGIGEQIIDRGKPVDKWFPENAYHTYWALAVAECCRERFPAEFKRSTRMAVEEARLKMLLWARTTMAEEVALHWAQSAALDSDQLAWSMAIFLRFAGDLSSDLRGQDLVRKGFEALGGTQQEIGTWRHYRPLFVYSIVGNAYCYVFETFTFLLKAALSQIHDQEYLEPILRDFAGRLAKLRRYAEITQIDIKGESGLATWSSGHRPADQNRAEGWATASVFSYFQAYRRVLGILARREALRALPGAQVRRDPEGALRMLAERGDTWSHPELSSVAEDLTTLIINPIQMHAEPDPSEPDDQPIDDPQARSAILFGPPGTSKTTLARSVAGALGWKYVELHSSHFVAEGIQAVQKTADRVFGYLMQLDHTVVLFDEPDELVREREGTADAFGRFLTTSMLPKLAQLWEQRRVIYFVATNHITYFDAAITRSQRFDILAFVPPPSFTVKIEVLEKEVKKLRNSPIRVSVTEPDVNRALDHIRNNYVLAPASEKSSSDDTYLPGEAELAKLVLLRFDQLDELALQLAAELRTRATNVVDVDVLSKALGRVRDHRLLDRRTYTNYLKEMAFARKDLKRKPVFAIRNPPLATQLQPFDDFRQSSDHRWWLICHSGELPDEVGPFRPKRTGSIGEVELTPTRG